MQTDPEDAALVMKRQRAMSLYAVLLVVSILAVLVSAMASLYLTNLQFSLSANNGEIAHSEADTALQEVMARIVYQSDYGNLGESVGIAPGDIPSQSTWHRLSYAENDLVPRSLYDPDSGQSHVFSVGYCRGEYRVMEAVIQPAEYSYALATEGPINTKDRFTARGVSDVNLPDQTNRPGNVLSNSNVNFSGDVDISGSLRMAGSLQSPVAPARFVVGGGVEQGLARRTLPSLAMSKVESQLPEPGKRIPITTDDMPDQNFDCITALDRVGSVTFEGNMKMEQGVLRVHSSGTDPGNLVLKKKLTGNGLLIVDGNVTIQDPDMRSGGQILVVAGGGIQVNGGFFRGLLYSQTRLQLSDCSVLGSAVVSPDPEKPASGAVSYGADVDGATVIGDPSGGQYRRTVDLYKGLKQGKSEAPFRLKGMGPETGPGGKSVGQSLLDVINGGNPDDLQLDPGFPSAWRWGPDEKGLYDAVDSMQAKVKALNDAREALASAQAAAGNAAPQDQAAADEEVARAQARVNALTDEVKTDADNLAKAYQAYMDGHATGSGGVAGKVFQKETVEVKLDLQKFLARSESVRMIYYKEQALHKL